MATSIPSAARSLTSRTLHLKVHPTPKTFSDQREVLRVIQQFGEVTVFKSLKYDPYRPVHNAFLALYSTDSSAQDLENASPIHYRLLSEPSDSASADSPEGNAADSTTVFELGVLRTNYNHNLFLHSSRRNPLHGPYVPVSPKSSYIAASLSKLVPDSNWSEGLVDWDTENAAWRHEDVLAPEEETRYRKDGDFASEGSLTAQQAGSRLRANTPRVMGGLQALWKERIENEERQRMSEAGEHFQDGNTEKTKAV